MESGRTSVPDNSANQNVNFSTGKRDTTTPSNLCNDRFEKRTAGLSFPVLSFVESENRKNVNKNEKIMLCI